MPANLDEILINHVQKQEVLYDLSHQFYYDIGVKEDAWEEIAESMNLPVKVVKKKWTALRDCYRKALKRKKTMSGERATDMPPWRYEKQMSFLKAHYNIKGNKRITLSDNAENEMTSQPAKETSEEGATSFAEEPSTTESSSIKLEGSSYYGEEFLPDEIITPPEENVPLEKSTSSTKKKRINFESGSSTAKEILTTYLEHKNSRQDHLTSYFRGIEDTVRTFSPLLQIEIKSRISSLVSEYEYRNLTGSSTTPHFPSPSSYCTPSTSAGDIEQIWK